MNDYRKSDFYHYFDNKSNTRRYFIRVYGSFIEVNKDVYYTCYNSYRKQLRDNRKDQENGLLSYDVHQLNGHTLLDMYGEDQNYLEDIYRKDLMNTIMNLIDTLDDADKELITQLLIENKKESELAKRYQVSQQMINRRKKKIIKSLREKLSDGYKKIKSFLFFWL